MRAFAPLLASAVAASIVMGGCGGSATTPAAGGLTLHVALATAPTGSDVAIASVALHLSSLHAVSDRSAVDPRAAASDVDLMLGDGVDLTLPSAPPGLYSAVDAQLGSAADSGLELQAVWHMARIHAAITTASFDASCVAPVALAPGHRARLDLEIDPASWFSGLDLGSAATDPDDAGIVISADDNAAMAAALVANVRASFTLDCAPE